MATKKHSSEPLVLETNSGFKFLTIDIFDGEVKSLYYNSETGLHEKRVPTQSELKRYKR